MTEGLHGKSNEVSSSVARVECAGCPARPAALRRSNLAPEPGGRLAVTSLTWTIKTLESDGRIEVALVLSYFKAEPFSQALACLRKT